MTNIIIAQSAPLRHDIKKIPGESDYFICTDGSVLSLKSGKLRKLKPWLSSAGYLQVDIGGKKKHVHRLLLETFVCPPPFPDAVVDHLDFNPQNNSLSNLRWYGRYANTRRTPETAHLHP